MAKAFKCDRCGLLYSPGDGLAMVPIHEDLIEVEVSVKSHPHPPIVLDLCPECRRKLEDFLGIFKGVRGV